MMKQILSLVYLKYFVLHLLTQNFYRCLFFSCLFLINPFMITEAVASKQPLPPHEAFMFSVSLNQTNNILAEWQIAPGYYLYQDRLIIEFIPNQVEATISYPSPRFKKDLTGNLIPTYSGHLQLPIQLKTKLTSLKLRFNYQGCSTDGFCYPPIHKEMMVNLTDQTVIEMIKEKTVNQGETTLRGLLTDQYHIQTLLKNNHPGMLWLVFLALGLLLAFTPCVLPMFPILMGVIVGQNRAVTTFGAFLLSTTYVLGSAVMYALAGLVAALLGSSLQVWLQKPLFIGMTSGLLVLLAVSLFGFYDLRLPQWLQTQMTLLSGKQKSGNYLGVFIMGALSTLMISPCVTAPLVGVLMYISETGDKWLGLSALFMMGIGMGLPLLLVGTTAGRWMPKTGAWMEAVKKVFGLLLLGMAFWLSARFLSYHLIFLLSFVFLAIVTLFFLIYLPTVIEFKKISRSLGMGIFLLGGLVLLHKIDIYNKMPKSQLPLSTPLLTEQSFVVIPDIETFNRKLALAQEQKKPVILDFYADWCEACVDMDKNVFNAPRVKQALNQYILLRADLTANSISDEQLLKYFNVLAPPTIIFFDADGKEISGKRIVGEVNAKEFLAKL